jgi:hypothetical protein
MAMLRVNTEAELDRAVLPWHALEPRTANDYLTAASDDDPRPETQSRRIVC